MFGHLDIQIKEKDKDLRFFTAMRVVTFSDRVEISHTDGSTEVIWTSQLEMCQTFPIY